eukprot:UN24563
MVKNLFASRMKTLDTRKKAYTPYFHLSKRIK